MSDLGKHDYSKDTFFGALCDLTSDEPFTFKEWLLILFIGFSPITLALWVMKKSLILALWTEVSFIGATITSIVKLLASLRL